MYAVIFIAEIKEIDDEYREYVEKLRELGKKQGCRDIYYVSDGQPKSQFPCGTAGKISRSGSKIPCTEKHNQNRTNGIKALKC